MSEKTALIVVPTYDEKENIPILIEQIYALDFRQYVKTLDVLVVDDSSPDGTADVVREIGKRNPAVKLLLREEKQGLGKAYVAGFQYALKNDYDYVFEMDADLSHDPKYLSDFFAAIRDHDLVIGSRYVRGVNVINWPLSRLLISYFGNTYARFVTGMKIKDTTSGFKCLRRETLEKIDLDRVSSNGYSFQIEMNYRAWTLGFKITEIPIIFYDRQIGQSKMSTNIVSEAFVLLIKLRIKKLFGNL